MANTYTKQTWTDGVSSASAARMSYIEDGIEGAWARKLAHTDFTSNASITATSEATATTIVTASAVTFDGSTACMIYFFSPLVEATTQTWNMRIVLYDGSSSIGYWSQAKFAGGSGEGENGVYLGRRLTPSAAAHTYSARAYMVSGTSGTVYGGTGGAANFMPGYIRIERD